MQVSTNQLLLSLKLIPGLGDKQIRLLLSHCGDLNSIFQTPITKLQALPGLKKAIPQQIQCGSYQDQAAAYLQWAEKQGINIISIFDERYPERLKQTPDAPFLLFYHGNADLNHHKIIGIVGTRKATSYGREVVKDIIEELKPHNPIIVSGLAFGIDIEAHRAALKAGLPTIGVMATGIDTIYPEAHKSTARIMRETGGILTEYLPGTTSDPRRFPARNRIIAGLSDTIIVVEAAAKGGALITAELAHSYDREVFAVPGGLNQPYSQGCNELIRSLKASIYTGARDLEYILSWEKHSSKYPKQPSYKQDDFAPEEWDLIQLLATQQNEMQIDEISWRIKKSINQVSSILLHLEFKGTVSSRPGKKFVLNR